ncbi:phage regulatory CII family protein [Polaromonas sp.]|uniref:phage regulatory CII family protein n=1 Tax=Polaromonas sp. TaxID=1869339 RepID=UPI00272F5467|nr:phage regulatory CII family protein [Polaromonas sp.]MDP1886630.1 hypothetical protein [Polaromonas sp.]
MSRKPAVPLSPVFVPLSPQAAFRAVVHGYGVEAMANALLMVEGTLHNKCNADEDSHHKPTMQDVVNVTRVSGDHRILESLDRMFNRAGYDLNAGPVSDEALLELLCRVNSESGAMHHALHKGLAQDDFSLNDLYLVRSEAFDLINAVLNFVQRLEGLVDE